MTWVEAIFVLLSLVTLGSALLVVTTSHLVHAALWLVVTLGSMAGIFLFGMLPAEDPRVMATMRALEERLWVKTAIGGCARYENDSFFQQSQDTANVPGNPWFVATLWVAEHHIAVAKSLADLERPRELLEWCATKANRSGVLAEQVHPLTGDPMSVAPLTCSHATYVGAVQRYARRSHLLKDRMRERAKSAGEVIA